MDFWTLFPYWGIFLIVIINAIIVHFMKVEITEEDDIKNEL